MSLDDKTDVRDSERRRKRLIIPMVYMLVEIVCLWLILALIQVKFNMLEWNFWALAIFILGSVYSIFKTIHIYKRQKDYLTEKEYNDLQ